MNKQVQQNNRLKNSKCFRFENIKSKQTVVLLLQYQYSCVMASIQRSILHHKAELF